MVFLGTSIPCPEVDVNFVGYRYKTIFTKQTWQQCSIECNMDVQCHGFSYYTRNYKQQFQRKLCFLKKKGYEKGRKASNGVISGTKRCQGTTISPVLYLIRHAY